MLTIIYPYKNREYARILNSINSLLSQNLKQVQIIVVDYGSDVPLNLNINGIEYIYLQVKNQPWNKSKAINYALKNKVNTPYFFIADIDMIFHSTFVNHVLETTKKHDFFYYQVAYLKQYLVNTSNFFDTQNFIKKSNTDATGMTVFKTEIMKQIQGFDEFFHFWGAEDTDVHNRIKNLGHDVFFYDKNILMVHQWHPSYMRLESKQLVQSLQLTNVIQMNHLHLKNNLVNKVTKVNTEDWGVISENDQLNLQPITLDTYKDQVDYTLEYVIQNLNKNQEFACKFRIPNEVNTIKYKLKKVLNKKVKPYYSLKEVNDRILLKIIGQWHQYTYRYKISEKLDAIYFNIKK